MKKTDLKKFAKYVVNYLNYEFADGVMPSDDDFFVGVIEDGIEAYESIEDIELEIKHLDIEIGDTIQITDSEDNCCFVPKATVYWIDEDTEGNKCYEITGNGDEDLMTWYSEKDCTIVKLS